MTLRDGASGQTVLELPGLGRLQASCTAGIATTALVNAAAAPLDVQYDRNDADARRISTSNVERRTLAPGASLAAGNTGTQSITWQASLADAAGARVATAWLTSGAAGSGCVVTAQALVS